MDIITWWQLRLNLEVPNNKLKEIDESFIPKNEQQALFKPPILPQAISDRLMIAPKYLAKGPKLINDMLQRAQKELMVASKPLLEVSMRSQTFLYLLKFIISNFISLAGCLIFLFNISDACLLSKC